uniref:Uncharacterized protein n=1 Tax=Glossina austeni TaxID=7395 RepID=A0A1A9VSL1_GLOAU
MLTPSLPSLKQLTKREERILSKTQQTRDNSRVSEKKVKWERKPNLVLLLFLSQRCFCISKASKTEAIDLPMFQLLNEIFDWMSNKQLNTPIGLLLLFAILTYLCSRDTVNVAVELELFIKYDTQIFQVFCYLDLLLVDCNVWGELSGVLIQSAKVLLSDRQKVVISHNKKTQVIFSDEIDGIFDYETVQRCIYSTHSQYKVVGRPTTLNSDLAGEEVIIKNLRPICFPEPSFEVIIVIFANGRAFEKSTING